MDEFDVRIRYRRDAEIIRHKVYPIVAIDKYYLVAASETNF